LSDQSDFIISLKYSITTTMTSTATGDSKSMYMRDDVKEYGYLGLYSGS